MRASKVARPVVGELEARLPLDSEGAAALAGLSPPNFALFAQAGAGFAAQAAAMGASWEAGGRVTYSFPPDGTDVFGVPSDLNAELSARGISATTWHAEVRMAADMWSAATGIRFDEVADDGSPIDAPGSLAGDPHFGDVRIVGVPLAPSELALTFDLPPSNWGTSAGDIVFNSHEPWGIQGAAPGAGPLARGGVDFPTVLLHELGHTLGVGELAPGSAVEHETYDGVKRTLTPSDTAAVPAPDGLGIGAVPSLDQVDWRPSGNCGGDLLPWAGSSKGPGDPAEVDVKVDAAGFFLLLPSWSMGGQVRVDRVDPGGKVEVLPDGPAHMYLQPGTYRFRAEADAPASFGFVFITPSYTLEELLPNGVGQAPAAQLSLVSLGSSGQPAPAGAPGPVGAPVSPPAFAPIPMSTPASTSTPAPAPAPAPVAIVESAWASRTSPAAIPTGSPWGLVGRPAPGGDRISAIGPSVDQGRVALAWNGDRPPPGVDLGRGPIASPTGLITTAGPSAEAVDGALTGVAEGWAWEDGLIDPADGPSSSRDLLAIDDAGRAVDVGGICQLAGLEDPCGLALLAGALIQGRVQIGAWKRRMARGRGLVRGTYAGNPSGRPEGRWRLDRPRTVS